MASRIARRLIGEAGDSRLPPSSAGADWFDGLSAQAQAVMLEHPGADAIELQATALIYGNKTLTYEEMRASETNSDGDVYQHATWDNVHEKGQSITAFSTYVHVSEEGVHHIEDYKTYEEAKAAADGLAAVLGVSVNDFTPSE